MTRLTTEDVATLDEDLGPLDDRLRAATGLDLRGLAAEAAGASAESVESMTFTVVPMTCGQGRIGGFGEAVAAIIGHIGGWAEVTPNCDACGMAEAVENGADVLFLADDERFVALDLVRRKTVDNAHATALGFVHALHRAAGTIAGREVMVIGAGPVGRRAIILLQQRGAKVLLAETNPDRAAVPGTRHVDLLEGLRSADLVMNASPAPLKGRWLRQGAIVSSPGVPFGFDREALSRATVIHDPLPTGVAVMAYQAASKMTMNQLAEKKEVAQDGY
jgi:pyrrolysine biosynthesis protein PylD